MIKDLITRNLVMAEKKKSKSRPSQSVAPASAKLMGDLLKKAASIGAGVYVTAEDAVNKTLNTVQVPPKLLREAIEGFFEEYTVTINAEVKLRRKDKKKDL